MNIRPERIADYPQIMEVLTRSFSNNLALAALVGILRSRPEFNPDFALVAEVDGQIVGYIIFNPITVIFEGQELKALNLSPLGVLPTHQKQGIGAALIEVGHFRANRQGYDFSIVLGHDDYYPRFGYQMNAYGRCTLTTPTADLEQMALDKQAPSLSEDELAALNAMFASNHADINLTLAPEASPSLMWLSPNAAVPTYVYRYQGDIVGYTRGTADDLRVFLARNSLIARAMAKQLAGDQDEITLPIHPDSNLANAFDAPAQCQPWAAGMICPLSRSGQIGRYLAAVAAGESMGQIIWSSAFDLA